MTYGRNMLEFLRDLLIKGWDEAAMIPMNKACIYIKTKCLFGFLKSIFGRYQFREFTSDVSFYLYCTYFLYSTMKRYIYIYRYIIRRLQIFLLKCIFSKISKKYNCNIKGVQKQMKTLPVFFFPRMQPTSSVLVAFYIFFCLCRTNMKAITICLS